MRASMMSPLEKLKGITWIVAVLALQAMIRENDLGIRWPWSGLWTFKILAVSDSVTLLTGLIGALVVLHQISITLKPCLSYYCRPTIESALALNQDGSLLWRCELRNEGSGSIYLDVDRIVLRHGIEDNPVNLETTDYDEVIETLRRVALKTGVDYAITRFTGFVLGPGKSHVLAELREPTWRSLDQLDYHFRCTSISGEQITRVVRVVPANGISQHIPTELSRSR